VEIQKLSVKDDFYHHYQPIFDIRTGELFGYEGLLRTDHFLSPEMFFDFAKKKNKLYELDSRSIYKAAVTYAEEGYFSRAGKLLLNVFPSTLTNPLFPTFINQILSSINLSTEQIILEINEDEILDFNKITKAVVKLKNLGIGIAIDDSGKGHSSIKSVIELNPQIIKLDRYFILNFNPKKIDVIQFLLHFCEKYSCKLIIEGVEEPKTLTLLKSLGVQYVQGYLLGRPSLLNEIKIGIK
jgi:EAL domain-containing protein (putative c-di-GMP-specific phosphodiesterase class I)